MAATGSGKAPHNKVVFQRVAVGVEGRSGDHGDVPGRDRDAVADGGVIDDLDIVEPDAGAHVDRLRAQRDAGALGGGGGELGRGDADGAVGEDHYIWCDRRGVGRLQPQHADGRRDADSTAGLASLTTRCGATLARRVIC